MSNTQFGDAVVTTFRYPVGGALGLMVATPRNEPIMVLSANLPNAKYKLGEGEFFLKNYSEYEQVAVAALEAGLFSLTGDREVSGFVSLPVARLTGNIR